MSAQSEDSPPVLVGQSPKIREILRLLKKLGPQKAPVLVLGETGTGKEVVARILHAYSPPGPFVTIDCSALVGPLMESELFGFARGAFTGAQSSKRGLIETAHLGTAFFDEIGELPLEMQVKLLRVLQEKELRPVGSLEKRKVDFRIVAATNRDLAREVEQGTFRRDLFYRLNVVVLKLPPLRERKEDIPILVQYFLDKFTAHHQITDDAMQCLVRYDWPGNVRELEHCIERMVSMNSGPALHSGDLPTTVQNSQLAARSAFQSVPQSLAATAGVSSVASFRSTGGSLRSLKEQEREAIIEALHFTNNDRSAAADLLGIGRTTLYRKLRLYKLR
jgi:transcriptional regulator with PAS, ATPase and Fis domain